MKAFLDFNSEKHATAAVPFEYRPKRHLEFTGEVLEDRLVRMEERRKQPE